MREREREREKERELETDREIQTERQRITKRKSVCVRKRERVCVCAREGQRKRGKDSRTNEALVWGGVGWGMDFSSCGP